MDMVAGALVIAFLLWLFRDRPPKPDPRRTSRYQRLEREHGTRWLERVHRSDFLSDAWGDWRDVNIHDYARWRREQGRPIR